MGDAGFIINKYNTPPNVNLITVKRKNQKEQNTEDNKAKLKNRYSPLGVYVHYQKIFNFLIK